MAEAISLKGIDNYGNTIDTCDKNSNKEDATLGTSSVNVCGTDATSNHELQATLTSQPVQHLKRNKYAYLIVTFAVSTCIASIVCASIVLYVVLNPGDTVIIQPEGNMPTSIPREPPVNHDTLQCVNSTELRLKAKEKMTSRFLDNNREFATTYQPVGCLHIPHGNCSGVLPYANTFIPNKHVDSFKTAENYLEEIDGLLDCDAHALYVVCSWLYPPCITDTLQVVPCKAVCEGVVNGCQEIFSTKAIGSELSCDYSPVGEANEMDCRKNCSYNIFLNVGEVFHFTSPNYPLAFPPNTYCVWLITSPSSTRIRFNITNVDLAGDFGHLQFSSEQNPYGIYSSRVTDDMEVFTVLNWASVTFESHSITNMRKGFTAEVTAIDKKDALSCTGSWWNKRIFVASLNEDELCDGQEKCKEYGDDEYFCRTECGYNVLLTNENSVEVVSSTNQSKAYEQCIYTFTCPTRTKLRMEFLSLKGAVSGCNFKMGAGRNPFNTTSELTTLPRMSTRIDFPGNSAWIWFAQGSEKSSFVARLSSFIESKNINIAANGSYIIDNNSHSINSWLEYGCLVFKSPPGYHFKVTFLNDILDLGMEYIWDPECNKIAFGLGSDPLKYNVFTLESDYDDMLELYTDAIWLKMDGYGPYSIGIMISTILTRREDYRTHIHVDEVATITYSSSEIDDVEVSSNVSTTVWIVTSTRHPNIAVKFINFSYGTSIFNFITIGHGLNPELSSSILFLGLASDFQRTLPDDFIINYSTFWVRHTSYRHINDTRFSMELRGIPDRDNLICPTKFGVTEQDICDDEFDCPDLRDEMDCFDSGISCGQRPLHPGVRTKRVIGGSEPLPGSWPWQGLIFIQHTGLCGCTLINELWAISASHCFLAFYNRLDDMRVMFGSTTHLNFSANHLIVPVSLVYFIPGDISYVGDGTDFVLMKLSRPVPFTNYIRPACISESYNQFTENDVCYVTGFGIQDSEPVVAMHEAPVNLFSNEKCNELQGTTFRMTENEICAGIREGGIDTCQGDSGGPLVCLGEDEKWYLVGITSYGYGCAERFRPGVYHRVFPYLDFIDNILNAELED